VPTVFDYVQTASLSHRKLVVSRKGHGTMVLAKPLQESDDLRVVDVSFQQLMPVTLKRSRFIPYA
jgi:hypothetical protein